MIHLVENILVKTERVIEIVGVGIREAVRHLRQRKSLRGVDRRPPVPHPWRDSIGTR